jgi:lysozyme family protein
MTKNIFDKSLEFTLKWEGGYVNHPNDPGGETNKGIIKSVYDSYRKEKGLSIRSVKEITDKEIKDIYYNKYWLLGKCEDIARISLKLAIVHFDTCVNTGVTQSAKFLQRSLKVKNDGKIGKGTLKALQDTYKEEIINDYIQQRENFYTLISNKNTKLKVFLKGWLKRVADLKKLLENLPNNGSLVNYCGNSFKNL